MKHLKKYKLFENFEQLKSICDEHLAYILDNNFYYYIDESDSKEFVRIELYKNNFEEDEGFYWSDVKDDYEVLIDLLTEYKYVIDEIIVVHFHGQENLVGKNIFDIKFDDDKLINELKMYIKK